MTLFTILAAINIVILFAILAFFAWAILSTYGDKP